LKVKITEAGIVAAGTAASLAPLARQATKELGDAAEVATKKMSEAGAAAADKAAQVAPSSTQTARVLADKAKVGAKDFRASIASLGAKAAIQAGDMIEKGAEKAAKQGDKLFNPLIKSGSDASSTSAGTEQNATTSASMFDLRIEVFAANDLGDPEYRLGDKSSGFLKYVGATTLASTVGASKHSAVYVELLLGSKKLETEAAKSSINEGRPSVSYSSERHLFAYRGEDQLQVAVRDKRSGQALLRGDPLIGEGSLQLDRDALEDLQQRRTEVPLLFNGTAAGKVVLEYRFSPTPGSDPAAFLDAPVGSVVSSSAVNTSMPASSTALAAAGASTDVTDDFLGSATAAPAESTAGQASSSIADDQPTHIVSTEFVTPPSSPR
jgi:hypothetical protein